MSNVLLRENRIQTVVLPEIGEVNLQVLYEVKKNRGTKAHTMVLDLRPWEDRPFEHKYALYCVDHGTFVTRPTRLPAEAESHQPATWCDQCEGEHIPPASPQSIEITDDLLRQTLLVVFNEHPSMRTLADQMFSGRITHARSVINNLLPLVTELEDGRIVTKWDPTDEKSERKVKAAFTRFLNKR